MTRSSSSSIPRGKSKVRKVGPREKQYSGPSFSELPNFILENIFARMTIKMIIICKCVCKTWSDIISKPEFAKIQFEQARISPFLRNSGVTFTSRMLYLVQPDQIESELNLYPSDNVELDAKLKLPLRNFKTILDETNRKGIKLNMKDHKFNVVNSCNGLLCLSDPSDNDPLIVCNPFTREFINLPNARTANQFLGLRNIHCGFGCGRTSNQYKVIRMFRNSSADGSVNSTEIVAEVHILGTQSWRNMGCFIWSILKLFPTYLNGCIYWLAEKSMISFDIDTEHFESVLSPVSLSTGRFDEVAMGALGEEICISMDQKYAICFWLLEDNGIEKSFSKIFSIHKYGVERWPSGSFLPVMYMSNGALLLYNSHTNAFIYKDLLQIGYRFLKVKGLDSKLEAILHTPSLVSLKNILSGHNVPVLNIKSRCGELKIHGEAKGLSLVEMKAQIE